MSEGENEIVRRAAETAKNNPDPNWRKVGVLLEDLADGDDEGVVNPNALEVAQGLLNTP